MESLLQHRAARVSRTLLDRRDECGVSGSFTLPDYCADIASVMTCTLTPHLQNRQWSGDRLLIDGAADVRVLYLDEERCRVHSAEFSLPFSFECKVDAATNSVPVTVDLGTRYVNWRVISPRCIEIRGAVLLGIFALTTEDILLSEGSGLNLETKGTTVRITSLEHTAEKVVTIGEQLDFPHNNPSAEMLLGGDCHAEVTECRLLTGKAIVKGVLYVHQLYSDNVDKGTTACLDYAIPFSQIIDIDGAEENQLYNVQVSCLSDTERCLAGPDGENNVLEVTAKLLIQLCLWDENTASVLLDAYHTAYPVSLQYDEFVHSAYLGCRRDVTNIPVPIDISSDGVSEILDVRVTPWDQNVVVKGQVAVISGKFRVFVIMRDRDGSIKHYQSNEDFRLEIPCVGDTIREKLSVKEVHYRADGTCLQLNVQLCSNLNMYQSCNHQIIKEIRIQDDCAYEKGTANLLMYYATPGESVWEIGRRCHASAKDICEENALTDDTITASRLLTIPL